MPSFLRFSSRAPRRWAAIALVALVATVLNGVPARAAAATHLELLNVDTTMTALRDTDAITVQAEDGSNSVDTSFGATPRTVTFTASCGDCFTITPNDSQTPGGSESPTTYTFSTFASGEMGTKNFNLVWKESAVGTGRTLTVAEPAVTSGSQGGIDILSNAPASLDLQGVQTGATAGSPEAITVNILNPQGQTQPNTYTGTVTFSASCDDCFTITPNNGTGDNAKKYTFVAGDNASKGFQMTWTNPAVGSGRTFTAAASDLAAPNADDSETRSGITIAEGAATTTTSTSTTSTSTTTTTIPRTKAGQVVTGAGQGGGPHVIARRASNPSQITHSFFAYTAGFSGGVRVATGDVNNDGFDDIITAPGPGGGPHVKVFSGNDLALIREFMAYAPGFTGGVYVASADVDNDGKDDIITGPGAGGGPHVQAFSGATGAVLRSFMAYEPGFTGGVRVGGGRFDDNNSAEIVTAPGPGGGPHVKFFSGSTGEDLGGFMAYNPTFTGGVFVAADRANTDEIEGLVYTGVGPGGGPHVRLIDPFASEEALGFMAGTGTNGAIPAIGESTNAAVSNVFVVSRAQGDSIVRFYSQEGAEIGSFPAYPGFTGGVFVAVAFL